MIITIGAFTDVIGRLFNFLLLLLLICKFVIRTASLFEMPRARYYQLKRMQLLLANQSEDCLYLNVYAPSEGSLFNNKIAMNQS